MIFLKPNVKPFNQMQRLSFKYKRGKRLKNIGFAQKIYKNSSF